jgi:CheY-like chemotaxis protein
MHTVMNRPILLVEDDVVDAKTVQRAFKDLRVTNRLDVVGNGEEALAFLRDANNEHPSLILLDLNMPKMNGIEFLRIAKQDDALKMIPVVVLTTSTEEQDVVDSYRMSVAGYLHKPVDYKQFVEVVRTIQFYWTLCETP